MDRERGRTDGWRARMNGQALDAALSGKGPHCDRDWLRPLRLAS